MSRQRASGQRSATTERSSAGAPDTRTNAVARAHGVVELLRASADRIEAARALPADVVAALHEARMFRLLLPRSLGGDELHLKTLAQVMEVIGGADASTAWCMGQGAGCAMAAASLKPEVARRLFGPADAVLAWGRARGQVSGGRPGSSPSRLGSAPRKRANGQQADRTLLFVKSKAKIHDMWHTLGLRGTASYTYEVEDLFVPEEETLDREDPTATFEPGTLYLFHETYAYAAAFSALMLGIAQGMVNDLEALAMSKTPRASASSLKDSPVFQSQRCPASKACIRRGERCPAASASCQHDLRSPGSASSAPM